MNESRPTTGALLFLTAVLGAYASGSGCDVACPAGSTLDSVRCALPGDLEGAQNVEPDAGSVPARDAAVPSDASAGTSDAGAMDAGDASASDDAGDTCLAGGGSEVCDGLDNDCDGVVDESDPECECLDGEIDQTCVAGLGVCAAGVRECAQGKWSACRSQLPQQAEDSCGDALDNDCDGETDEANAHCEEPSYRCVDARCVPNGDFRGALETAGGYVLSMANGGGFGTPLDGPQTPIHTDAISDMGAWEQFEIVWQDVAFTKFALKTADGVHYVTAVNGGGIAGPNNEFCPIHTDARSASDWETVTLHMAGRSVSIRTASGNYLSAPNGGGIGGPDTMPIHTDATQIGTNEIFVLRK